jgi:hypothetical protein
MLSLADLAQEADRRRMSERSQMTMEEVGNTLSAVYMPESPRSR